MMPSALMGARSTGNTLVVPVDLICKLQGCRFTGLTVRNLQPAVQTLLSLHVTDGH